MQDECDHILVITYRRPWRRLFKMTYIIRCWFCDLKIEE